ncbi:F-box domain-containing protein [Paramyrothecium foliicola]|nr:F-box domain-containing protein [Paramyrothecium foliicola]
MEVATESVQAVSRSSLIQVGTWDSLPTEIRDIILGMVGWPSSGRPYNRSGSPKVARFTTVCKEWQDFFEPLTFRRLVLNFDSLAKFGTIIRRQDTRLGYIRKIWLRIQLCKYHCHDCERPEDRAVEDRNNLMFMKCIHTLLGTLRRWDPTRHRAEGLTLMLSASSPSDTEHWFWPCEMEDAYPFHYAEDLNLVPGLAEYHNSHVPSSAGVNYHFAYDVPWHGAHIHRMRGNPLRLGLKRDKRGHFISKYRDVPAAPIIKGLVMRRQFRREIHLESLAWLLSQSFVELEWFRLERTLLPEFEQAFFDRDVQLHLLPSLPKTLRQLSLTQWERPSSEPVFDLEVVPDGVYDEIPPLKEVPKGLSVGLTRDMAQLSLRLEQFCPPWQTGTAAFLRSISELRESPQALGSSLKRMVLRCVLPKFGSKRQDFESLVELAAKAALSLPQLEIMELWGTHLDDLDDLDSRAYIFLYTLEDRQASIVWRSCGEPMDAQAQSVADWREVAAQKSPYSTLEYRFVPFVETGADVFRSRGACIFEHLRLKELVVDPITQKLLEIETYR